LSLNFSGLVQGRSHPEVRVLSPPNKFRARPSKIVKRWVLINPSVP